MLQNLDLTIQPGKIYGLIGRNGAGKTTLLGILTAQNTKDAGEVTYGGQPVWENQAVLSQICFSRELQATQFGGQNNLKVRDYLRGGHLLPQLGPGIRRPAAPSSSWRPRRRSASCPRARCPW